MSVSATSTSTTKTYKKAYKEAYTVVLGVGNIIPLFKHIPYIHHLVWFIKSQVKFQALLDFDSEVNIMTLVYMTRQGFKVRLTDIEVQKIDSFTI